MNKKEIWKPIPWAEGYEVSTMGRVMSFHRHGGGRAYNKENLKVGRLMTLGGVRGYLRVGLNINGRVKCFNMHRLVARVFLGEPPEGYQVHHIDFDKHNNRLENLKFVTPSENSLFEWRANRRGHLRDFLKERNRKLSDAQVKEVFKRSVAGGGGGAWKIGKRI